MSNHAAPPPPPPLAPVVLDAGPLLLRPPLTTDHVAALELALDPDVRQWNPRCRIADEASALRDCAEGADWSGGTEAAFTLADRATGRYTVGNAASCRVAERAGYRLEQVLPASKRFGDGRLHDEHLHVRGT